MMTRLRRSHRRQQPELAFAHRRPLALAQWTSRRRRVGSAVSAGIRLSFDRIPWQRLCDIRPTGHGETIGAALVLRFWGLSGERKSLSIA